MGLSQAFSWTYFSTVRVTKKIRPFPRYYSTNAIEATPKSVTEKFTESIARVATQTAHHKAQREKKTCNTQNREGTNKLLKPTEGYTPRFKYNGFVRKKHWVYYDDNHEKAKIETPEQVDYRMLKKQKFCFLMAFAGGNYYGMQYNASVATIEDKLLKAMLKNGWILDEHWHSPWKFEFQRGSRTDRGVSAARQNVSMVLPINVNVEDLNRDLPADIRVFGMKRVTPKFDARHNCNARTYSYTLPTIAFSHYNDQTEMKNYRITADRMQRANEILGLYRGQTNFHNYTEKKLFFDRSSQRRIDEIGCGEPFIENGIEFARITVTGESFMLHQIRKMVGFSLAVIRGVVTDDLLARSLTKEIFHTPTAPGLGLMLDRLHFTQYANTFKTHDPLTFNEYDEAVEKFRREYIHPYIVEKEIEEQSMVQWLEYLCIHRFDEQSREREENRRFHDDPHFEDEWGEDPKFVEKLKKHLSE